MFISGFLKTPMIHTNPNPRMSKSEIIEFRSNLRKCISNDFTPEEKFIIKEQIKRINKVAKRILANNGGKNPILGY